MLKLGQCGKPLGERGGESILCAAECGGLGSGGAMAEETELVTSGWISLKAGSLKADGPPWRDSYRE